MGYAMMDLVLRKGEDRAERSSRNGDFKSVLEDIDLSGARELC